MTHSRRIIVRVIAGMGRPFTATELTQAVSAADATVGRASVYRALLLLRQRGFVERLHGGTDAERYTLCLQTAHHHHVTCSRCGRTDEFTLQDGDAALNRAVAALGYVPEYHVLEAYGICPACLSGEGDHA